VGGSGATVIEAARRGVQAVGCDLSVEAIVHASAFAQAEGVASRARFVVCPAEALPFPDGTFGCASAVAVLEHVEDDALAVRELARVVRPGGHVWVTVPNAYRYIPPPLWPVYRLHDRRLGHKRHYDVAALTRVMQHAGFRHRSTSFSGHPVKVLQLVLDRLLPVGAERRKRIWWGLEERDLRGDHRALGALQLSAVFERLDHAGTESGS
jgi:SAM-dependent methyltransferase